MTSKKFLVSLVMVLAIAILAIANVSAMFGNIESVEVSGVEGLPQGRADIAVFAGETIPVKVIFRATNNAEDVRVKTWVSGERELATVSERFDVIANKTYSKILSVKVPSDLDELAESIELNVVVENRNDGIGDEEIVLLTLERESYVVEILDVDMVDKISAGEVLALDVVLKNRGRQFAEDTFVRASIPALEIEDRAFFGDLSSIDEPFSKDPFKAERTDGFDRLDKEDSAERRLFLRIPSDAPAGVYLVEVEAYNDDSETKITKRVVITGVETESNVLAPVHSKSFAVGETSGYDLVLVNSGNRLKVFELVIESPNELSIDVSEPIVALPAGTSKTVKLQTSASKEGIYNFAVNVHSGAQLIKQESFTANVNGSEVIAAGSPAVLLTVVLAVIFIVLLIVLIVLLTRKPEKSEETGESYY